MNNRVIRDIRYYELKPDHYTDKFDGILGNVYKGSTEIRRIGQRIARKLNELNFISGDFDHLYIYLTNKLDNETIVEHDFEYDTQMRCFDYGQDIGVFNNLTESEREKRIKEITFKVLNWKFGQNKNDKAIIDLVESQIEKQGRELVINYMDKETKNYKLCIGFQIAPTDTKSTLVVDYQAKKDNRRLRTMVDLNHFEDIYYLVDKISIDGNQIIFKPKKSIRAEFVTENYPSPLTIQIKELEPVD